jgi:hypothetical protein
MSSTINALTSGGGLAMAGDTSGQLALQSAGTTFATGNQYGIGLGTAVPSSGIGIAFPATQSASSDANTLDDYEEGTWTPSWNVTGGSWTSSSYVAKYTKIGRQVTCNMYWVTSAISGTKVNALNGLPFTSANDGAKYAVTITANSIGLSGAIPVSELNANATTCNMQFSYQSTTGWQDFLTSAISSGSTISMTFTYFV